MTDQEIKKEETVKAKNLEEKIKDFMDQIRPYAKRLWDLRKKLIILNGIVAIIALAYLYLLTKPYFESSVTILPEYGSKSTTLSSLTQLASISWC